MGPGDLDDRIAAAPKRRSDQEQPLAGPIHDNGEIKLAPELESFHQQDLVANDSVWSLLGDEFLPQHSLGNLSGSTGIGNDVDAAHEAVSKGSGIPGARQNLCLENGVSKHLLAIIVIVVVAAVGVWCRWFVLLKVSAKQILGFFRVRGRVPPGSADPVFSQQFHGRKFVEIEIPNGSHGCGGRCGMMVVGVGVRVRVRVGVSVGVVHIVDIDKGFCWC
mmetsp:Transcript_14004/g.28827  ORF Transcript_14004/g.28827 Transcript_14004/m.28827 type:complete len:219 (+) Transcript_14004:949-1605(+)